MKEKTQTKTQAHHSAAVENPILDFLRKYAAPGQSLSPVLLKGPQGTSKTFEARKFGRGKDFDRFIEIGGHRGLESFDLMGQFVLKDSTSLWKDGPLAEAFRFAGCSREEDLPKALRTGKKVFLLIDEIYRIPAREREIFLNALQPETIRGVRCYKLRTGRPLATSENEVSREEILYAPSCLVSIVATTNVGLNFDVDEDCIAGRERWVAQYVGIGNERFLQIVQAELRENGYRPELAFKFLDLFKAMDNAANDGLLRGGLSLRTAVRIIESATSETDLARTCAEVLGICVDSDANGRPLPKQQEALRTLIRKSGLGQLSDSGPGLGAAPGPFPPSVAAVEEELYFEEFEDDDEIAF